MLDTLRHVETPEGLALNLRCAGVMPRAYAWLIDFALRWTVIGTLASLLAIFGDAGEGLALLAMFLLYWGYPIVLEVMLDGQTLGKKAMGLRVVNGNGTPVTWLPSIVRNLLRFVDMMPLGYGFGLVCGLFDRHGRRLGDLAAGTVVVYVDRVGSRVAAAPVPALAPPQALRIDEQGAIVAFAERAPQMTVERQEELADLLAPLTQAQGQRGVHRLFGIANHLLGRR
ncbi:RDD family protein [Arenimonas sp.]|uniref:RDD family protein n=1 Tax=Arenimonas sp. TaxID=1872635 RepID=UPI0039E4AFCB